MILGLAPMDGITDCPYRLIVQDVFDLYGNNDQLMTWTEFMSADGYMINPSRLIKHLITTDTEKQLIAQIYGGNKETLINTAIDIQEKYTSFAGIELNIGCPSPKVMSCGAGAAMMRNKDNTLAIIKTMSELISIPFSIKTRTGISEEDKEDRFSFIVEASYYCSTITVHGRTFTQSHSGLVDRDYIYRLREEINPQCVLIGNGGITSYHHALEKSQSLASGFSNIGIMIGQAAIGNPRIFTEHLPSQEERIQTSLKHLYLMAAYEVYLEHTRLQFPEESDQIALNRKHLHMVKKYDPNSDDISDLPPIMPHSYLFPMPSRATLDQYAYSIQHGIQSGKSFIDFGDFERDIAHLRTGVDIRKYLFTYIAGISNNKLIKQQIITTKKLSDIVHILS